MGGNYDTTWRTSLALVTNFSSWSCNDFNRPSRCSSWPRRHVNTTDKNGWLPSNDVLQWNHLGTQHVSQPYYSEITSALNISASNTATSDWKIIMLYNIKTDSKYQQLVTRLLAYRNVLCNACNALKQQLSFIILPILNHVKQLKPLKQKTLRINTIWCNSVVTKHCCE